MSGCVDDAADDAGDVLEMFRAVVFRFAEVFRDGAAEGFMHAELDGAAADAVDAERQVEQGAERGQRPDDAEPDGGGAGIALVQQRVAGGEQAASKSNPAARCGQNLSRSGVPVHVRGVSVEKLPGASAGKTDG